MRTKRILAFILMIAMLSGNTLSVYATSAATGVFAEGNEIATEVFSEEDSVEKLDKESPEEELNESPDEEELDEESRKNLSDEPAEGDSGDDSIDGSGEKFEEDIDEGESVEESSEVETTEEEMTEEEITTEELLLGEGVISFYGDGAPVILDEATLEEDNGEFLATWITKINTESEIEDYKYAKSQMVITFTYQASDNFANQFYLYVSDTEDGAYTLMDVDVVVANEEYVDRQSDTKTYSFVVDRADDSTVPYYKIVPVYLSEGTETEVSASDALHDVKPQMSYQTSSPQDLYQNGYVGTCFVDENNLLIDQLKIHVGESKEVAPAVINVDGTITVVRDAQDFIVDVMGQSEDYILGVFPQYWYFYTGSTQGWNDDAMRKVPTWSTLDNFSICVVAESKVEDYVLSCYQALGDKMEASIPVTILDAEEGVIYKQPEEIVIAESIDEEIELIRKRMVNRDTSPILALREDGDMSDLDPYMLVDFLGEREGMEPYEGDYLNHCVGDPVNVVSDFSWFTEPEVFEYNGNSYLKYGIDMPFLTTRAQEDEVDAKIKELMQDGGALYHLKNASRREQIEGIYSYIVNNVSGTVPGDRKTPIYHTAYHALIKGSGTCEAFAVLFTRLAREFGIPSKVIMGTDSAAHSYNIVEVEPGDWYFIDANTERGITPGNQFSRVAEQSQYSEPDFKVNYMSKIVGQQYAPVHVDIDGYYYSTESLGDEEGNRREATERVTSSSFEEAVKLINSYGEYIPNWEDMNSSSELHKLYIENISIELSANTSLKSDVSFTTNHVVNIVCPTKSVDNGEGVLEEEVVPVRLDFAGRTVSVKDIEKLVVGANVTVTDSSQKGKLKITGEGVYSSDTLPVDTFKNINWMLPNGTLQLVVNEGDTGITVTDGIYSLPVEMQAKNINVVSGKWVIPSLTVTDLSVSTDLYSENVTVSNALTVESGSFWAKNVNNPKTIEVKSGAALYMDTLTQSKTGILTLHGGATVSFDGKADIYNLILEGGESASLYLGKDADLSLVTSVKVGVNPSKLIIGASANDMFAEESETKFVALSGGNITRQIKLFTSNIKLLDMSLFEVKQASEEFTVYQVGTDVYAGKRSIQIYAVSVSGEENLQESFAVWSDAVNYLNNLSNTSMEYVVEITDDLDINQNLTLPTKVKSMTYRGVGVTPIRLTYTGDLKLVTDTIFDNLVLVGKKYNSKTKTYEEYHSTVAMNGKNLTFHNVKADFTSISGNGKNTLTLTGNNQGDVDTFATDIFVDKAMTSIGYLEMGHASVKADNLTVSQCLTMESSLITCVTKINLKDMTSEDEGNRIVYGGNESKNILNITGNIFSGIDDKGETPTEFNLGTPVTIKKNAIDIDATFLNSDYTNNPLLCNVTKAGAAWFAVGSTYTVSDGKTVRTAITNGTYKKGNGIYFGTSSEAVKLFSSGDETEYSYEGGFATLQDALAEIDKIALADQYYRIELTNTTKDVVTLSNKALTFPSKTAGLSIGAPDETDGAIHFKGNITLKSNLTLDGVMLVPYSKTTIALGNYELTLKQCDINEMNAVIGSVNGSGVDKTSHLILDETVLLVRGNVDNIGTVTYDDSKLSAEGKINVGDVVLTTDGYMTGGATVTRDRTKENITKIASQITIQREVIGNGKILYLDLQEKVNGQYESIDFNSNETNVIRTTGVQFAKATQVSYTNIKALQLANVNELASEDGRLIKAAGYLTYYTGGPAVELSYVDGGLVTIPCHFFADAVTEINNLKIKREYTITLLDNIAEASGANQEAGIGTVPVSLTMPNKSYISKLTIKNKDDQNKTKMQLGFVNNISLTSDVVLDGVQFVQMQKVNGQWVTSDVAKNGYPAAVTLNTSGFALDIFDDVTFNTPLVLNGGSKGVLRLNNVGTITTLTNKVSAVIPYKNTIYGMITNFAEVQLNDTDLILRDYESAENSGKFTSSVNKVTTMYVTGMNYGDGSKSGNVIVESSQVKGSFTVDNLYLSYADIDVDGKINVKNLAIEEDGATVIKADLDFNITNSFVNESSDTVIYTALKGVGKAPYLNISAQVIRVGDAAPITVGVYNDAKTIAAGGEEFTDLYNAPKETAQLLTAKSAYANDFKPLGLNVYNRGEFNPASEADANGYIMMKSGSNIYVYYGDEVDVAVYRGDLDSDDFEDDDALNNAFVGYFPTVKDATSFVDFLKDLSQEYTFVITKNNGDLDSPVTITVPKQARTVKFITHPENGDAIVFLNGNITLNAATIFENIHFAPIKSKKATTFNISTGGHDLTLTDIQVSNGGAVEGTASLKDISGNGKGDVILNVSADCPEKIFKMLGSITNASWVKVKNPFITNGNLKADTLLLESNDESDFTYKVNGTITIKDLYNDGAQSNVLEFTRNSSNVTNLTINGEVDYQNVPVILRQSSDKTVKTLSINEKGQIVMGNEHKIANMPKAWVEKIDGTSVKALLEFEGMYVDAESGVSASYNPAGRYMLVKANKGLYLVDADTVIKHGVSVVRNYIDETDVNKYVVNTYFDYAQAIDEINNIGDVTSAYSISFNSSDLRNEIDLKLTDTSKYSAFPLPQSNKADGIYISGQLEEDKVITEISFTGNISGYGGIEFGDLILNPVKSATNSEPVDFRISVGADKTDSYLVLDNVSTLTQEVETDKDTGFISAISGVNNKTNAGIYNCDNLILKTGFSNLSSLCLENTHVVTGGANKVNTLYLSEDSSLVSLGKLTVKELVDDDKDTESVSSFVGAKQNQNGVPQFELTTDAYFTAGVGREQIICKLYDKDVTFKDSDEIFREASGETIVTGDLEIPNEAYDNAALLSGKAASADKFCAYPYVGNASIVSYKDGAYIRNGTEASMQVKVTEYSADNGEIFADFTMVSLNGGNFTKTGSFYATSFEGAVTGINNRNDKNAYYVVELLSDYLSYGVLTLPTKAAGVLITGKQDEKNSVVKYTGTLKSSVNVRFEDIILIEGKTDKNQEDGFLENNFITPAPANNMKMVFASTVFTSEDGNKFAVASINSTKGAVTFDNNEVISTGNISIGTLTLLNGASLVTDGKITLNDLVVDGPESESVINKVSGKQAISIKNITSLDEGIGKLNLDTYFTKISKPDAMGSTQLTISEIIDNVNVTITPYQYQLTPIEGGKYTGEYEQMDNDYLQKLFVINDGKTDAYKKLATMQKASLDFITVNGTDVDYIAYNKAGEESQTYLYKYETGIYLTNVVPVVRVEGFYDESNLLYEDADKIYEAEFLSWDQAVKEIEKINNNKNHYKMTILKNIGANNDEITTPLGTVSMPSKAKEVTVTSSEYNGILFTGTTLTLKCNTVLKDIALVCLKKSGSGVNISYTPVVYTINVGNFHVQHDNMVTSLAGKTADAPKLSGSAKGIYECVTSANNAFAFTEVKNVGELRINSGITFDVINDVNVKKLKMSDALLNARNVTVSTLATLGKAKIKAGTMAADDGKMTLKDIALRDNGNVLTVKQNKSGASQLTINGTVVKTTNAELDAIRPGAIEVELLYNNGLMPVQLYQDIVLATAQKVAADIFAPEDEAHPAVDKYGIYKSGKNICYGYDGAFEAKLTIGNGMTERFRTFEEAVKEIDNLSLYKDPTAKQKVYEDYTITLLGNVEIGNEKKNDSYSSLSLPNKAEQLVIDGDGKEVIFSGNVSIKCDTELKNIRMHPVKKVKNEAVLSPVNYALGNYTLKWNDVTSKDESGNDLVANISGSSKSGTFELVDTLTVSQVSGLQQVILHPDTELHVNKNYSAYQVQFISKFGKELPILAVDEKLTVTQIVSTETSAVDVNDDFIYGIIQKPVKSVVTINGVYEDRDKDKVKEYYSLLFEDNDNNEIDDDMSGKTDNGCIKIQIDGEECPVGTTILSGKYLKWNDVEDCFKVFYGEQLYNTYSNKTTLYLGKEEAS